MVIDRCPAYSNDGGCERIQADSTIHVIRTPRGSAKATAPRRIKDDYIYIEMVGINYNWARPTEPASAMQSGLFLTVSI